MTIDTNHLRQLLAVTEPGPVKWEGITIDYDEPASNGLPYIRVPECAVLAPTVFQTADRDFEGAGEEHLLLQEARNALPELLDRSDALTEALQLISDGTRGWEWYSRVDALLARYPQEATA